MKKTIILFVLVLVASIVIQDQIVGQENLPFCGDPLKEEMLTVKIYDYGRDTVYTGAVMPRENIPSGTGFYVALVCEDQETQIIRCVPILYTEEWKDAVENSFLVLPAVLVEQNE